MGGLVTPPNQAIATERQELDTGPGKNKKYLLQHILYMPI